ncbi:hypothetical protein BDN72DRAFT_865990 [Pluteus cervinus]|uniref:Uncharacterized protein n=1 Tax=Pluteus cervinus TaxID=181527 RepID=A0ACD2ZYW8_9AGAR|nr:hypothetical protein BDN72DRAFT_865990 [Pluteus cervinus]
MTTEMTTTESKWRGDAGEDEHGEKRRGIASLARLSNADHVTLVEDPDSKSAFFVSPKSTPPPPLPPQLQRLHRCAFGRFDAYSQSPWLLKLEGLLVQMRIHLLRSGKADYQERSEAERFTAEDDSQCKSVEAPNSLSPPSSTVWPQNPAQRSGRARQQDQRRGGKTILRELSGSESYPFSLLCDELKVIRSTLCELWALSKLSGL